MGNDWKTNLGAKRESEKGGGEFSKERGGGCRIFCTNHVVGNKHKVEGLIFQI